MTHTRTLIIGAGAAGLHCASFTAPAGTTILVDHSKNPGEKIRISGGGRCNFTNLYSGHGNFISQNAHFAKSAFARYTQWDFIDLMVKHGIAYHEKTLGQLFCDDTAKDVVAMLLKESEPAKLRIETEVSEVRKIDGGFEVDLTDNSTVTCDNLVIATGGKSIPKMGATGFGYQIARQFGLNVVETRAALVPLTFGDDDLEMFKDLAGVSLNATITCNDTSFTEALLFTHRGLSGPAILQISSFWQETDAITLNLFPDSDPYEIMIEKRTENGRRNISTVLADMLPARLAAALAEQWELTDNIADYSNDALGEIAYALTNWEIQPIGTEGYRTAEVTLGGVDTDDLNARTMEAKSTPGLYFIGEVVDVTGWLGGYNFQWAWSSAHAAGTAIAAKYA